MKVRPEECVSEGAKSGLSDVAKVSWFFCFQ